MDPALSFLALLLALAAIAAWMFSFMKRMSDANKQQEIASAAQTEARWKQAERDLALSCVTQVNGFPCSGLGAPIRGTNDRYRCPVCGAQFAGVPHGW